ncbi:hypothetical protein C7M60_10510 [Clostridium botulinum]|nr:hypothetical protein C7M60_10510 [Clostridium botulinum]AVQ49804.1 hypothetical protein C7M58_10890 [Clostridium botulinum]
MIDVIIFNIISIFNITSKQNNIYHNTILESYAPLKIGRLKNKNLLLERGVFLYSKELNIQLKKYEILKDYGDENYIGNYH